MFNCPYFDYLNMFRQQYSITINLNDKRLYLIREGKIVKSYPVAIGKPTSTIPPHMKRSVSVAMISNNCSSIKKHTPYGKHYMYFTIRSVSHQ